MQLKVMSEMAIQMGHGSLAYLLDMARLEAENLWPLAGKKELGPR